MNIKKIGHFSYAVLLCTVAMDLSAQPFGYPYDPYDNSPGAHSPNHPADPYHRPENMDPGLGFPQRNIPPASTNNYNKPLKLQSESFTPASQLDSNYRDPTGNTISLQEDQNAQKIDRLLSFWFGPLESPAYFPVNKIPIWEGNPQADQEMSSFSQDYQNAMNGQYGSWRQTPKGLLALILLLDIVPRHIYSQQSKMFAADRMALGLAQEGIRSGEDLKLFPIERAFFYMPFQHSEDPNIQALSVKLYQKLVQQSPEQLKPMMQEFLKLAAKHKETIDRFGRFPHRNDMLDRKSTPEELDYLSRESSLRY